MTLKEVDGCGGTTICMNSQVQSHGTEDGRWRGGRAREVYNNDFHPARAASGGVGGIRSGVTVFHDNTVDGPWPGDSMYQLQAYRLMFQMACLPIRRSYRRQSLGRQTTRTAFTRAARQQAAATQSTSLIRPRTGRRTNGQDTQPSLPETIRLHSFRGTRRTRSMSFTTPTAAEVTFGAQATAIKFTGFRLL